MRSEASASWSLKIAAWAVVAFLHVPLALIILYAFSAEDKSYVFPPPALTTQWFGVAWDRPDVWQAITLSLHPPRWATTRSACPQASELRSTRRMARTQRL